MPQFYCSVLMTIILMMVQFMIVAFAQRSNVTFTLRHQREPRSNHITLSCQNASNLNEPRAMFFLNKTELNSTNFGSINSGPGMIIFEIKRVSEGQYSCGIGEARSNLILLIAYPTLDNSVIIKKSTSYAVERDTAVLDCAIPPGALIHYYYVIWKNGSRPIFIQSKPTLRNAAFPDKLESIDPRYRIDAMNLSLLIDKVRRSDSFQDYHCVLQVLDPGSDNTHVYDSTRRENISLTVLSPPNIIVKPQTNTVRQNRNVIFTCKAEGHPPPMISWQHNGMTVIDNDADFIVRLYSNNSESMSSTMVTSDLRILSPDVDMTGEVTCIASADSPEGSSITLADHSASSSLTVLGKFNSFDVLISRGGDVIFFFKLPQVYNQSVHLFINYIDDLSNRSHNRTTEIGFVHSKSIVHVDYSSHVPYIRFRVEARLVSGGVHGPLSTAPGVYDKYRATLCEGGIDKHIALIFGITPAGFLFLVCIALVIAICVLLCALIKEDPYTRRLVHHMVKNNEPDTEVSSKTSPTTPSVDTTTSDGIQVLAHNGGVDSVDAPGNPERPSLEQQPSVISTNKKFQHKDNPVYRLVKQSMKDAKLPQRKYRRLKEELRTSCNKCIKKDD